MRGNETTFRSSRNVHEYNYSLKPSTHVFGSLRTANCKGSHNDYYVTKKTQRYNQY